jgi:hypothetical protein
MLSAKIADVIQWEHGIGRWLRTSQVPASATTLPAAMTPCSGPA